MFIDLVKVKVTAGRGGDGFVSFRQEKFVDKGGPDGGDGGRGGDVIFEATSNLNTLLDLRLKPLLKAEDGAGGERQKRRGKSGQNLITMVPIGTIIYQEDEIIADLTEHGQQAVIARGGDGGFGNSHFKSSTRQAPRVAEKGEFGDHFEARIELKLLADIGLVGLPNAGKSSFLGQVTSAKPEVADYQFTTLVPNLGVAYVDSDSLLIADIPGLIEGASQGKGLGTTFLRHVERTSVLLHLIDIYSEDIGRDYQVIRQELANYSQELIKRPELIVLTKTEGVSPAKIKAAIKILQKLTTQPTEILAISSFAKIGLTETLRKLVELTKTANQNSTESSNPLDDDLPVIALTETKSQMAWLVRKRHNYFHVSGSKIEKFGRRTDFNNPEGLNRLRNIMKKMGIMRELIKQGATGETKIKIKGTETSFTLEEQ